MKENDGGEELVVSTRVAPDLVLGGEEVSLASDELLESIVAAEVGNQGKTVQLVGMVTE